MPPQPQPIRVMRVIAYADAMQDASSSADVDDEPPDLAVTEAPGGSSSSEIAGTARDNLAIKAVRWRDDGGGSGVAELTWKVLSGNYSSGYDWEMRWSFPAGDLTSGANRVTIVAEDIKGNEAASAVQSIP